MWNLSVLIFGMNFDLAGTFLSHGVWKHNILNVALLC